MSRHASPPRDDDRPPAPEPTYAERARTLLHVARFGTLASVSRKHPGHPFASLMPYAIDPCGRPLFLVSSMAMHTQNVAADPRASLFVTQPNPELVSESGDRGAPRLRRDAPSAGSSRGIDSPSMTMVGDPLAHARVTVMGEVRPVAATDVDDVRAMYLARHEHAAYWVDFTDFRFWRLDVMDLYYVGGFGAMDWVTADGYSAARPDPLADVAPGILEHMNRDHPDALVLYARALAGEAADEARMVAVDRLGFKLRLRSGERQHSVRIAFPVEVTTAADARATLIAMLRDARARV
jgi:putative heme iron utilization protein